MYLQAIEEVQTTLRRELEDSNKEWVEGNSKLESRINTLSNESSERFTVSFLCLVSLLEWWHVLSCVCRKTIFRIQELWVNACVCMYVCLCVRGFVWVGGCLSLFAALYVSVSVLLSACVVFFVGVCV